MKISADNLKRNFEIYQEFKNGKNMKELAIKYDLKERTIQVIIRERVFPILIDFLSNYIKKHSYITIKSLANEFISLNFNNIANNSFPQYLKRSFGQRLRYIINIFMDKEKLIKYGSKTYKVKK